MYTINTKIEEVVKEFDFVNDWIDTITWMKEDKFGIHDSPACPLHVPNSDKHTLPFA